MNNQHELGVVVMLDNLRVPTADEWGQIELLSEGVEVRFVIASEMGTRPGWKWLVGDFDRTFGADFTPVECGEKLARKHAPNCRNLCFIDDVARCVKIADETGTNVLGRVWGMAKTPVHDPLACSWAPVRGGMPVEHPWQGTYAPKPWEFACEIAIPVIDCHDCITEVAALWRLQTIKPHIVLIDTGSTPENLAKLEAMRGPDLEIHSLRMHATRHPSDFPAIAMDLAFSLCRTDKLVATHSDVFPRRRDVLEELLGLCGPDKPAVGYQMTPRNRPGWKKVVTHSLACFYMPTMDGIGAGWSLRRACRRKGVLHTHYVEELGNLLDTELALSLRLESYGIAPHFIGTEQNWEQTLDDRIRHVRSLPGSRLYSPAHQAKAEGWLVDALEEARTNIELWSQS